VWLEAWLRRYEGTLLVVSHDRAFLNRVTASTWVFEGEGRIMEYVGGYDDWLRQRPAQTAVSLPGKPAAAIASAATPAASAPAAGKRKLSFKEQRELQEMPARIEALEAEQRALAERLAGTELYTREPQQVPLLQARYAQIEDELMQALERWEALGQPG